jgi:hypothetical protein
MPAKSGFEQVHPVSFDHESNLVKTLFYVHYYMATARNHQERSTGSFAE